MHRNTAVANAPVRHLKTADLPSIGAPFLGGFFAGLINVASVLHALVVAPKATGETRAKWLDDYTSVPAANSWFDGRANTTAMAEAGSPAAKWAQALDIGGFTDWHVPARDQLELLYRHFKPTAQENDGYRQGDNPSSVPPGYPYTDALPAQTQISGFGEGGAEAFEDRWYWTSTQLDEGYAWLQLFNTGNQLDIGKEYEASVRAVRLIQLDS